MKVTFLALLIFLIIVLSGCSQSISQDDNPGWVNELIIGFKRKPVGNPPQSIWKYSYKDQPVFYTPAQCCDQFSILYDQSGNIICAPDGGINGQGDGKCRDFFQTRKEEKLIWKDSRVPD